MKANEAPEKIYIHVRANKELGTTWHGKKITNSDIEYVRTDAFIEKALKFLDEKFYFNNLHYSIESGVFDSEEEMFEDFKNSLKGE